MRFLLFLFFSFFLHAQDYSFLKYETQFKHAITKAIKEDKLLMLFEVQNGCIWCSRQAHKTLLDEAVKHNITKYFVPLLLNLDSDIVPLPYHSEVVPALYFINPNDDEEVWRAVGYKKACEMLDIFKEARKSYANDLADERE